MDSVCVVLGYGCMWLWDLSVSGCSLWLSVVVVLAKYCCVLLGAVVEFGLVWLLVSVGVVLC